MATHSVGTFIWRTIRVNQQSKIHVIFSYTHILIQIDIYCQGIQLNDENKTFNDYDIDNDEQLVIVPRARLTTESIMAISAGRE
jgi:hypothetical protein